MRSSNIVLLRGRVSSEPRHRELPSGSTVVELSVTTAPGVTAPIVVHGPDPGVRRGDDVVVAGHVAQRFFRVGGATRSRTEVVADEIRRVRAVRSVRRLEQRLVDAILEPTP